jgi:hypothetical protein
MQLKERTSHVQTWISTASAWQTFLLVFVPLLAIFFATMSKQNFETNADAVASALPAWRFAQFGDIDLSQFQGRGLRWIIDVNGSILSNRPPGISFVSVPFYWLFGGRSFVGVVPSMLPATATAAVFSAGAVGVLHLVLRRITTPVLAVGAAFVFGLGTSTWSMAANELWPHGPAMFFLALALLAMASNRYLAAGVGFGGAILIRPVTALLAAAAGLILGFQKRSVRTVVLIALGSAAGLGLLVLYYHLVLGEASVAPPSYGSSFVTRARTQSPLAYLGDVGGMLFHPKYSIFVFSPFLLFTLPGIRTAWKGADPWVRASALAAVVYMLIHLRLNRFSGGPAFNYRYPLEMLVMAAPLLFLSWQAWFNRTSSLGRRLFLYSILVSLTAQALAIWIEFTNPTV